MNDVGQIQTATSALQTAVRSVSVSDCTSGELKQLVASVRSAQRCLDGLVTRIGITSDRLATKGRSAPAGEMLLDGGSVSGSTARRDASRSKVSANVPGLADALIGGAISGDHVDSIARHTTKLTDTERASVDFDRLVDTASNLPAGTFDAHVKRHVENVKADHGLSDTISKKKASEFRHWYDPKTGMGKFSGQLDPERYETLTTAIDAHVSTLATQTGGTITKDANTTAQALVELVTTARAGRRAVPLINIVVDHDTIVHGAHPASIRQTGNGHDIAPETIARLCCDAVVQKTTLNDTGVPIHVGRKYRTATDAQWAAIRAIYSSCAWNGCERPLSWCQLHHILEWENRGPTDLDNLVPLCATHHHHVHEGRWSVKFKTASNVAADRSLLILEPDTGNGPKLHATTKPPTRKPPDIPNPSDSIKSKPNADTARQAAPSSAAPRPTNQPTPSHYQPNYQRTAGHKNPRSVPIAFTR